MNTFLFNILERKVRTLSALHETETDLNQQTIMALDEFHDEVFSLIADALDIEVLLVMTIELGQVELSAEEGAALVM